MKADALRDADRRRAERLARARRASSRSMRGTCSTRPISITRSRAARPTTAWRGAGAASASAAARRAATTSASRARCRRCPGMPAPLKALCVVPFGMEEGTERVDRPTASSGWSSASRPSSGSSARTVRKTDRGRRADRGLGRRPRGAEPARSDAAASTGKDDATVPVTLESRVTEVGTLELWCVARDGSRPLEARAQHPGARALTDAARAARRSSASISAPPTRRSRGPTPRGADRASSTFRSSSRRARSARRPTLPSFLYFADQPQRDARRACGCRGTPRPTSSPACFARDQGALVPARQIASAKSWLSNPRVDRTARAPAVGRRRRAAAVAGRGVGAPARAPARRVEPRRARASDEALAARAPADRPDRAGLVRRGGARADGAGGARAPASSSSRCSRSRWRRSTPGSPRTAAQLADAFADGALILVCDVGGGTTDFSLIRDADRRRRARLRAHRDRRAPAARRRQPRPRAGRAGRAEARRRPARLTLTQRQVLRRKCSAAKEQLLSDRRAERAVSRCSAAAAASSAAG